MKEDGRPIVTVISPTLSGNALFRTQALVRLLRYRFDVQLIGFDREARQYVPLAEDDASHPDHRYHASNVVAWRLEVNRLRQHVRGKVVIAVKPLLGSFGAGLYISRALRLPLMVDIDDWEPGFLSSSVYWEARQTGLRWLYHTGSPLFTRVLDDCLHRAAAVTVSNAFLQGLYGGHWIPHPRPAAFHEIARRVMASSPKVVLFAGAPRGHKGLPLLLRAWQQIDARDAILRLVLSDRDDPTVRALEREAPRNVEILGPVPFSAMTKHLAEATIAVVPQDNAPGAVGQLPMKLIDAMAAGRAIVATDVCDAARWLADGAGLVVPPGSPDRLAEALNLALASPQLCERLGRLAHERFLEWAAEEVLAPRLCAIVDDVIAGRKPAVVPAFERRSAVFEGAATH